MQWILTVLTIVFCVVLVTTDDDEPQALDQDDYANQEYASADEDSLPEDASFLTKAWCRIRCFGKKCCGTGSCQCQKLPDRFSRPGHVGPRPRFMVPHPGRMVPRPGRMVPHWRDWRVEGRP